MLHNNGVKTSNTLRSAFNGNEAHPDNGKQADQGDKSQQSVDSRRRNHFISVHKSSPFLQLTLSAAHRKLNDRNHHQNQNQHNADG